MSKERTFLDPFNESADLLRECKDDLAILARALHATGNSVLAGKLGQNAADISEAIKLAGEGRDMALGRYVSAV